MNVKSTVGMYDTFERSGALTRSTHYCAGCGHGILHKLITEALVEMDIQDRVIMINPIGCAVFGYYYWDVGSIGAAHGRAPAIGTALARTLPEAIVIAYQGDGDLAAIGFNCAFQAASRGERMVTFLVNNATYGMTGGQMSPTSLVGQRTVTSPHGRSAASEGYPLHVCEVFNQLRAPVYLARCSVADSPRIAQTKKAIRRALTIQLEGRGYALLEILSPCPTTSGGDSLAAARFVAEDLEKEFPLGVLRDTADQAAPAAPQPPVRRKLDEFFRSSSRGTLAPRLDPSIIERRLLFAGSGGQGILSLGLCVAEAGSFAERFTTWYPAYGPEQRGGSASCALVLAGTPVGSPAVDRPDVLICMTRPMLERHLASVKPGGFLFCDTALLDDKAPSRADIRMIAIPATDLAVATGFPRAANTAILAALLYTGATGLPAEAMIKARDGALLKKPTLIAKNREVFDAATAWCQEHLK